MAFSPQWTSINLESFCKWCSINWQARHDIQQSEPSVAKETNPGQIIKDAAEIRQNEEVLKVIIFVETWSK